MRKHAVSAGILSACLLCSAGISAKAYTADDVAQKAREAGWPEYLIQSGYNEWASGSYTQEDLNEAYNSVESYNEQTEEMICNAFGVEPQPKPDPGTDPAPANPTNPPENPTSPETSVNPENGNTSNPDSTAAPGNPTPGIPDRISSSDFINMTLEEKQNYVNSLGDDQKSEFLASLSKEERNSIIKQFPTEQKVALMQNYIDTASSMGMNVVVDSMTDQNISVTVRNDEGVIIDKAGVGVVIDETGISHTKPLVFAGLGILTAAAGFVLLYWYSKTTENQ